MEQIIKKGWKNTKIIRIYNRGKIGRCIKHYKALIKKSIQYRYGIQSYIHHYSEKDIK